MDDPLSILYVGDMREGTTCLQRMRALTKLGHNVSSIDYVGNLAERPILVGWERFTYKLYRMHLIPRFRAIDIAKANRSIMNHVRNYPVNVLWIEKGRTISARTLREVKKVQPHCIIVSFLVDDMMGRHNQSIQFLECVPLYDIIYTTKTYGIADLRTLGGSRVYFTPNSFDPNIHRPMHVADDEKVKIGGEVGFVGFYEEDRARSLQFLASHGIQVRIYGGGWKSIKNSRYMYVEQKPVWDEDYAKVLCSFDINMCFLRRMNRDRQTTRSVEIPACGAFMLAERTDEHLELFKEGVEAEFFSTDRELLEKVRYYLDHPEKRTQIAEAGRQRCLESGYSYPDRLRSILEKVRKTSHPL